MNHSPASRLRGLHAALMTPYADNGDISDGCLKALIAHVLAKGLDGLYVGGSTGEALLHTTAERQHVFNICAEHANGAALIGQVGSLSTREAKTLAKTCASLKYDAVSAIPPIYFPHKKDAIFGYFRDVAEAADGLPVIVYNIPAMSGVSFTIDDLRHLFDIPNVIGIKQTSIDMYQMEQLRRNFPKLVILNGYDEMLLSGLAAGADGGIGSTYNIMGRRYVSLKRCVEEGDVEMARELQHACNEVIDALVKFGVFPSLKYILWKHGIIKSPACRAPLATLSNGIEALDQIAKDLQAD